MEFLPRAYQQQAIDRMLATPYQLLALRMGAGKTVVSLTVIDKLKCKTLVVAPLRVSELVWAAEASKWYHTSHLVVSKVLGPVSQRLEALEREADVYIVNRENFPWLVEQFGRWFPFECVIIDENRGFKDRASKSWKALNSVRQYIKHLYMLTGTPTPNSLLELWAQISVMDGGKRLEKGLGRYREKYFNPDKRNGSIIYSWKLKPGADKLIYEAVADVMLSIDSDIEMPERIDNVIPVSFDMDRYHELEHTLVSDSIYAVNPAVLAGKLAQMANGAVYDDTRGVHEIHDSKLNALEEIVEQGEPVLCFTSYQHDQARIIKRFPDAVVFDGAPSFEKWKAGKVKLLLMHPASGGHGVDGLQLGGNVAVWFGLPFSLDLYEQANARLHRPGQKSTVTVHHIVAVNTIDQRIIKVLQTKGDMQQALLDAVNELKGKA